MGKIKGFTLIEVMITVAIVGILASIAYPSYTDFILRSNRAEAQRELLRFANAQEQVFSDRRKYMNDMRKIGGNANPYITESKNYSISAVRNINNRTFTLKATATNGQTRDTDCLTMKINQAGVKLPATGCWE
jgi:type IV pilus assembly protein PilE